MREKMNGEVRIEGEGASEWGMCVSEEEMCVSEGEGGEEGERIRQRGKD